MDHAASRREPASAPTSPGTVPVHVCHDCGLLHRRHPLAEGTRARCTRCGAVLYARKRHGTERALALYLAALLLWGVANAFTLLVFKLQGRQQPARLISGSISLYNDGLWELALIVFLFVIVFPLLKILANLAVLVPVRLGRRPRYLAPVFRTVDRIHPWAMTEVFLLGVLVAYAKLLDLATLTIGPSLIAVVALIIAMVAADAALEPLAVWEHIRPAEPVRLPPPPGVRYVSCHTCEWVSAMPRTAGHATPPCPRCGSAIHARKPNSLSRAWALGTAAAILYIPANLYPVMTVISFGRGEPDTILSGVKELLAAGMWPLALLVFFASVTVPMLKLVGLLYLLISVQRRSRWRLRDRTMLYRVVEAVGRWSMIDIFMLSILAALVQLGAIATITPGIGAIAFAGVVVITMFAAMAFDPRLIWDAAGANHDR